MYFIRWFVGMVVILGVSIAVFAASPLETNQWRVELTPEGASIAHFIDRLRFEDGNFASVIFERKGFLTSSYASTAKRDGSIVWEAKQKSNTDGEISWQGELQGDAMTGTLVWKQPDGKTTQYAMNGRVVPVEVEVEEGAAAEPGKSTDPESAPAAKKWWGCSLVRSFGD